LALALTVAACGSSDDSEASDTAESSTDAETTSGDTGDTTAGGSEPEDAVDEGDATGGESGTDDSGDGNGAGTDVAIGSGTVTIDGVANSGFAGECEIARANGAEPVGDVSSGELDLVVAVDNAASGPTQEMNFVATGSSGVFSVYAPPDRSSGTIDSIAYVDEPSDSAAVVEFSGTTEDGRAVVAQLGCSLYEI
jgi:hypothetical protein